MKIFYDSEICMHKYEISIPRSLEMDPSDLIIQFPSTVLLLKSPSPNELEPEAPKPNAALPFPAPSSQPKTPFQLMKKNQDVIKIQSLIISLL